MVQGVQSVFPPRRGLNTRHVVEFRDFSGGEFGTLGPLAPHNSFTATNIVRYIDGSIGPRPGLRNVTPATGLANGSVLALGRTDRSDYTNWFLSTNGSVYGFNAANTATAAVAYTGAVALAGTTDRQAGQVWSDTDLSWLTVYGDKLYKIDHNARTVTAVSASPATQFIALYGARLMLAGDNARPYRLFFSAAADFNTWPARNYVDIGDSAPITGLFPLRNQLLIAKLNAWYLMTGVPGVSDTVRPLSRNDFDFIPRAGYAAVINPTDVLGLSSYSDYPTIYRGPISTGLRHLTMSAMAYSETRLPPPIVVSAMKRTGDGFLLNTSGGTSRAALRRDNTWTLHTFGPSLVGYASSPRVLPLPGLILTDGGGAAATPKFYSWAVSDLERPPLSTDTFANFGDDSATALVANISTPEWWGPTGNDFKVRSVLVDFTKYSTGSTQTNHFDLSVDATRIYETAGTSRSATYTFDETPAGGASGTRVRKEFAMAEQGSGAGFIVNFTNIRGIKIHGFDVTLDLSGPRTQ